MLVIDELPYLAQAEPATLTILQRWWDRVRKDRATNLKVFLLGSLVSWMEEHTLSERGPIHHRRTGQIRLDPLSYADAALFYPRYAPEERVAAYAISALSRKWVVESWQTASSAARRSRAASTAVLRAVPVVKERPWRRSYLRACHSGSMGLSLGLYAGK